VQYIEKYDEKVYIYKTINIKLVLKSIRNDHGSIIADKFFYDEYVTSLVLM